MQTEQRAMELEAELALAHDALQDWRTLTANMSTSTSEDSWRWVHAAEEEARNRQEAVLRSLINFMHTKQEQMNQHHQKQSRLGRRGSSDSSTGGSMSSAVSSPFGRRMSIAPEDMMGRSKRTESPYELKEFPVKTFEKEEEIVPDEEDDTMSEEEEKRQEAKLRQVELLVRRMSQHLEETVNVSAPRVAPTSQDVKSSSRMQPIRR
jgi:hypothetical protein